MIFRHGDVLFAQVETIPENTRKDESEDAKRGLIQHGESTGHAHVIEDMAGVELFSSWRERFLASEKEFTIRHEEHKPITVPPGKYQIKIAREFDYSQNAARMVVD
jgi:hypothetical protein